jgi:predicted DCC family thiol-disulfide oxidoreductase YuxK
MLVIIDGDCSFCRWASGWLRRLGDAKLEIISQDQVPELVLKAFVSNESWSADSIKVISNGNLFIKSQAIAEVLRTSRWFAQPLRIFFILPDFLLDTIYDWVARNRKSQSCSLE